MAADIEKVPYFRSIGEHDLLMDQFTRLVIYIYSPNEKVKNSVFASLSNPSVIYFKNTRFATMSKEDLPKTLDNLYTLYLTQPIIDKDRKEFLSMFMIPFMSTGKTLASLHSINKEAFSETLDALIISKRIQRILSHLDILRREIPIPLTKDPSISASLVTDVERLRKEYIAKYTEQEANIATAWFRAIEREPEFKAKNILHKASAMGNEGSKHKRKTQRRKRSRRYTRN